MYRCELLFLILICSLYSSGQSTLEALNYWKLKLQDKLDLQSNSASAQQEWDIIYPVLLNDWDQQQLNEALLFNQQQIDEITEHKKRYGPFCSVYELQLLTSFSQADIMHLLALVQLESRPVETKIKSVSTWSAATPLKSGFVSEHYKGGPSHLRQSLEINLNNLRIGIRLEKDPGEALLMPNGRVSYASAYAEGKTRSVHYCFGNYDLSFGQGLTLFTGFTVGGRYGTQSVRQYGHGISAKRSYQENSGFTGLALAIEKNKWQLIGFQSKQRIDATVLNGHYYSLGGSGLHRTQSEIKRYNRVSQYHQGLAVLFRSKALELGMLLLKQKCDLPAAVNPKPTHLFDQRESIQFRSGLFASFSKSNYLFFSELSWNNHKALSGILGLSQSLNRQLKWSALLRKIAAAHIDEQTQVFSSSSRPNSESGLYVASQLNLTSLQIELGLDYYRKSWISTGIQQPYYGHVTHLDIVTGHRSLRYRIRLRRHSRWLSKAVEHKQRLLVQIDHELSKRSTARLIIAVQEELPSEHKSSIIQLKLQTRSQNNKIRYSSELAIANNGGRSGAFYLYTAGLEQQFKWQQFHHSGLYLNQRLYFKINRLVQIGGRISLFHLQDKMYSLAHQPQIGSGYEQINGRFKNTFALQLIWKNT